MVEISKNNGDSNIAVKRVRFAKRRYERAELLLNEPETQADVREAIANFIAENRLGEDTLLELKLTGFVHPSLVIDIEAIEDSCTSLFMLKVIDATRPSINLEILKEDISIRGEVYRKLYPYLSSPDPRQQEVALRALRYALSALDGENSF
jgi:hypothetical protein